MPPSQERRARALNAPAIVNHRAAAQRVAALVAALGMFPLFAVVIKRAVDVPYWDEWEWAELVYAAHRHTLTFARLWQPHNEHRILVPNLLALGLDAFGGWSPIREQLLSLALLAATQLALWVLFRRTVPASWRGLAFLAATVLLLGLVQFENLDWGFQMAWFLCDLAVVAVVALLTAPHASTRDVVLAAAVATVASLSSSQGLLAWAAGLVAIALVPRRAIVRAIVWATAGVAVIAIVRAGATAGGEGHASVTQAGLLIRYVLVYLGAPLALAYGAVAATLAGAALAAWLIGLAFVAARGPLALRRRLAPWLAVASYPVLAAGMTAIARAGYGVEQATSSRYTSIATLAWIAALAGTCIVARRSDLRRASAAGLRAAAVAIVALVVVVASVKQTLATNRAWQLHAADLRTARSSIAAGDPRGLTLVTPDPDWVTDLLAALAQVHDGVFRP